MYTDIGNNLKDCKDCTDCKDSCPEIIDDELKEDCKKYTNDSFIFNTFRVVKEKYIIFFHILESLYMISLSNLLVN